MRWEDNTKGASNWSRKQDKVMGIGYVINIC